jgi:hypothetical protein
LRDPPFNVHVAIELVNQAADLGGVVEGFAREANQAERMAAVRKPKAVGPLIFEEADQNGVRLCRSHKKSSNPFSLSVTNSPLHLAEVTLQEPLVRPVPRQA